MNIKVNPENDHPEFNPDPLKWFNRFSFVFGTSLSVKGFSRPLRFYYRIHGFINISYAFFVLIYFLNQVIKRPKLYEIHVIFFNLGLVIYVGIIQVFGQKIHRQFNEISRNCSRSQMQVIKWITLIGWTVIIIDRITFSYIMFVNKKSMFLSFHAYIRSFNVCFYFHSFLVYCLFVVTFYFSASNLIKNLETSRQLSSKIIYETLSRIEVSINHVNRFAVLPFFLLIPYLFIALPAAASKVKRFEYVKSRAVLEFVLNFLLFIYCIIVISMVLLIIILKHRLKERIKGVVDNSMTSFEGRNFLTNEWNICFDRLLQEKLFDFSVFNLFSIDFSFLMSLFSAIVTFSILFFQLENN